MVKVQAQINRFFIYMNISEDRTFHWVGGLSSHCRKSTSRGSSSVNTKCPPQPPPIVVMTKQHHRFPKCLGSTTLPENHLKQKQTNKTNGLYIYVSVFLSAFCRTSFQKFCPHQHLETDQPSNASVCQDLFSLFIDLLSFLLQTMLQR